MTSVTDLLHLVSRRGQSLFAERGGLRSQIWAVEKADGTRDLYETNCEIGDEAASDAEALDALIETQRHAFAVDGVRAFAVCFPSIVGQVRPGPTILHLPTRHRIDAIVIESYNATTSLRAHMEIVRDPFRPPRLLPLTPVVQAQPPSPFASLLYTET
jgi:hypothetical protein